jgi:hypothetical protein
LVKNHHSSLKRDSRDFYRLDSAKVYFESKCDYILNDTEWEGIKRRCPFSNEHAVDALDKLITAIDSHLQESPLFAPQNTEDSLLIKKELLAYLNLLKKYLPKWYNLPPPLANNVNCELGELLYERLYSPLKDKTEFSYMRMHVDDDCPTEDLPTSCYDFEEHPFKWLLEVLNYLKNLRTQIDGSYLILNEGDSFFDFPTTDLIISVKEFAYLNGDCKKLLIMDLPEDDKEEALLILDLKEEYGALYAYQVVNDTGETLQGFPPELVYPALEALERIVLSTTNQHHRLFWKRAGPVCQMRWLLQATQRSLTQIERNYVHRNLWNRAWQFVFLQEVFDLLCGMGQIPVRFRDKKLICIGDTMETSGPL